VSQTLDTATPSTDGSAPARIREQIHFTVESGWINDPHGICWAGGQYHLFFQYNPTGNVWSPKVHWGHAVSPDLVHWQYTGVALAPRPDEEGCWSGSTIVENDQPTIFYTSVLADNWGHGRVALALPDKNLEHWSSQEQDILIDGAPPELSAYAFRDPCIFPTADRWTMIVGVGVGGGTGLAVQYKSTDARHWSYDGVICSRPGTETDGVWTGTLWECPQLFQVGDDWVLMVSIWENDILHYVATAVGTYDGTTFVPERWSRLTHDDSAYAMTSFRDNQGRPCVMSWLRESPDHDPQSSRWASSLSLPVLVEISPNRTVALRPHPDVDTLRESRPTHDGPLDDQHIHISAGTALDIEITLTLGQHVEISLADQNGTAATVRANSEFVVVERRGNADTKVPKASEQIRIILDTDLAEIYAGNGSASLRIPASDATLNIIGSAEHAAVHRLSPRTPLEAADNKFGPRIAASRVCP